MPKLLVLASSPRPKGNSTILALEAARGARDAGAEVKTFRLAKMEIGPCLACDGCRKPQAAGCVQKDDMKTLYAELRASDAVLIASPVYWFTMSAQVKLFMDRLYAFGAESYQPLKGKRVGIILTYGDADPFVSGAVNALRSFQDAFAYVGAPIEGMVYGSADKPGEVRANKILMKDSYALGQKLGAVPCFS
ncbi:MAG: flavodoxin family protein [Candidatus Aminicenantes bacterium]|nr:flavodoxin family protein [Candidatus Aminicenantes bacterium]